MQSPLHRAARHCCEQKAEKRAPWPPWLPSPCGAKTFKLCYANADCNKLAIPRQKQTLKTRNFIFRQAEPRQQLQGHHAQNLRSGQYVPNEHSVSEKGKKKKNVRTITRRDANGQHRLVRHFGNIALCLSGNSGDGRMVSHLNHNRDHTEQLAPNTFLRMLRTNCLVAPACPFSSTYSVSFRQNTCPVQAKYSRGSKMIRGCPRRTRGSREIPFSRA